MAQNWPKVQKRRVEGIGVTLPMDGRPLGNGARPGIGRRLNPGVDVVVKGARLLELRAAP
jgi:hypothetical protein